MIHLIELNKRRDFIWLMMGEFNSYGSGYNLILWGFEMTFSRKIFFCPQGFKPKMFRALKKLAYGGR